MKGPLTVKTSLRVHPFDGSMGGYTHHNNSVQLLQHLVVSVTVTKSLHLPNRSCQMKCVPNLLDFLISRIHLGKSS